MVCCHAGGISTPFLDSCKAYPPSWVYDSTLLSTGELSKAENGGGGGMQNYV